jgi:hypothetical protein
MNTARKVYCFREADPPRLETGELPTPFDMVISVLSLADDAYRAQFEAMVAQNASDTTHGGGNKQLVSNIQGLAEAHRVLPPGAVNCKPTIIVSGLVELVLKSYNPGSRGGTQVVYAASSLGKTTAFEAFTTRLLPDDIAALMITGYRSSSGSYASHMADVLWSR